MNNEEVSTTDALPTAEQVHATAAAYLLDGENYFAAEILILCSLHCEADGSSWMNGNYGTRGALIVLTGPRVAFDILNDPRSEIREQIRIAIDVALGPFWYIGGLTAALEPIRTIPGWREEMAEQLRSHRTNN